MKIIYLNAGHMDNDTSFDVLGDRINRLAITNGANFICLQDYNLKLEKKTPCATRNGMSTGLKMFKLHNKRLVSLNTETIPIGQLKSFEEKGYPTTGQTCMEVFKNGGYAIVNVYINWKLNIESRLEDYKIILDKIVELSKEYCVYFGGDWNSSGAVGEFSQASLKKVYDLYKSESINLSLQEMLGLQAMFVDRGFQFDFPKDDKGVYKYQFQFENVFSSEEIMINAQDGDLKSKALSEFAKPFVVDASGSTNSKEKIKIHQPIDFISDHKGVILEIN